MPQILQHFQAGDCDSSDLVVFMQGWPDNAAMWDWINWKEELSNKHLLFINFPNTNGKVDLKWGKDFPQLLEDIKQSLDSLNVESKNKILVAHDWGCFYGYMFDEKNPGYFKQLIMLDVPGKIQLASLKTIFMVVAYQIYLVIAFFIGGSFGKFMTQKAMKFFKHNPPYASKVHSYQNYPYYYLWRNKFLSAIKLKKLYLSNYHPSAPVVYLYGGHKPFQFHGEKWFKIVKQGGGEIHRMEGGHWFMKKYAKFVTDIIQRKILPKI